MNSFYPLLQKILSWNEVSTSPLNIYGANDSQWSSILSFWNKETSKIFSEHSHLIVLATHEDAELFFQSLQHGIGNSEETPLFFFPGLERSPYSGIIASEKSFYDRFDILAKIIQLQSQKAHCIVVTTFEALSLKLPTQDFFIKNSFEIKADEIISPFELKEKLVYLGYTPASSVEEPGTFVQKGEVFDIYPVGGRPVRLFYFDDLIEEIYPIDLETQKTIRDLKVDSVTLSPGALVLARQEYSISLREKLPQPQIAFKNKYEHRKGIFQSLSSNQLFENYPIYLPLFFNETITLLDYFNHSSTLTTILSQHQTERNFLDYIQDLKSEWEGYDNDYNADILLPHFNDIYNFNFFTNLDVQKCLFINQLNLQAHLLDEDAFIDLSLIKSSTFFRQHVNPSLDRPEYIKEIFSFIKEQFKFTGQVIFSPYSESSKTEIEHLLSLYNLSNELKGRISYTDFRIDEGFYHPSSNFIIISDGDIFSAKKASTKKKSKFELDLFAEQLATLKPGDFVVHAEYGVGEYLGLESLEIAGDKSDFIILKYSDNDKVYVPVYKLNQIQKHADAAASLKTDSLRTNKFLALKARAKNHVKTLAFDLLKLQAERHISKAYAFSPPDHLYREFELAFPFHETPDQSRAIEEVLEAMQRPTPMDYLVCGDVGFGKTEVAMRAAFKAVEDKKQVAVLVPTTILALQHYNSFSKRFKEFPVRIEFISRFKSPSESRAILEKAKRGEIDILIGTHKLLSQDLKFQDLGLVIVDEEQRFGVGHKEKLKLMKASVDFLTLTATPIPRTLQMAFLGLRDLSLIKTPPPNRQSIKTYVIKEDEQTIQTAILKELQRGGQVFIVHNRVSDIEQYTASIRELAPEAKIVFAHGQMSESELEDKINAFYNGEYQILVATTIIESGIDIPNANTMIIDRADTYGLAQLHQLRGRIGRSDKKAYAYFVVPRLREVSLVAQKRLQALRAYADLGAGFNIASVDLEIRGAGDLLGANQSGHIEAIGLELYTELLKEAIAEIKGETKFIRKDIEMVTPFSAFIPKTYISDAGDRLKQYKRLSNCESFEHLENLKAEFQDIYGHFSEPISNLFTILETRINLQTLGLKNLHVGGRSITLKFDKEFLEGQKSLRDKIIQFFISRPKVYQFTPDFKVIYTHKEAVTQNDLLNFSKDLAKSFL